MKYSSDNVKVTWGDIPLEGFAPNSLIEVKPQKRLWYKVLESNQQETKLEIETRRFTYTISLKDSSKSLASILDLEPTIESPFEEK